MAPALDWVLSDRDHDALAAVVPEHVRLMSIVVGFAQADVVDSQTLQWSRDLLPAGSDLLASLRSKWPNIDSTTVESFQERATVPGEIVTELLRADMPLHIWSVQDLGPGYDSNGPSREFEARFIKAFPGALGWLIASRPGFNTDGTQALIYYGSCRANRPQAWYWYVLLDRTADGWAVTGVCQL